MSPDWVEEFYVFKNPQRERNLTPPHISLGKSQQKMFGKGEGHSQKNLKGDWV